MTEAAPPQGGAAMPEIAPRAQSASPPESAIRQAYALINEIAKTERRTKRRGGRSSARTGIHRPTMRRIMEALGWHWIPTMKIGEGCRVHLSADELPAGRIIVSLSRHYAAVIDGELHDTHDCSRDGTRCVYGYWRAPGENADRASRE